MSNSVSAVKLSSISSASLRTSSARVRQKSGANSSFSGINRTAASGGMIGISF
jgi:hypothetical protein